MFLISPSKTKNYENLTDHKIELVFPEKTNYLAKVLKNFNIEDFKHYFHLSDMLANEAIEEFSCYPDKTQKACELFTGTLYQEIQNPDNPFFNKSCLIMSAFYGVCHPQDYISPYRLDFEGRDFIGENLYRFWGDSITNYIKEQNYDYLVDLTDEEFFKCIDVSQIECPIYQCELAQLELGPTNVRKVRGQIVNYVINNEITNLDDLTNLHTDLIGKIVINHQDKIIFVEANILD